jgi:hypothetical protein
MPRTDFSRFREYRCKVLTSWARIFLHISVPKWIPYALTASSLSLIGSKAAMISAGTCEKSTFQAQFAVELFLGNINILTRYKYISG